jgi:hypothetical protein
MAEELAPQVVDLGADLFEVAVDTLTDSGVLKDIPVLGSAVKIAVIGKTIHDRIFLTKIHRFLAATESDHFAVDDVGEHRPKALALPALDLIESEMPRAPFRARPIPLGLKGPLGAPGFAPSSLHGGPRRDSWASTENPRRSAASSAG